MKSNTFLILGAVVLLAGGAWFFTSRQNSPSEMNITDTTVQPTVVEADSRYNPYSLEAFEAATTKKRVLFFFAPWCPTCVPADKAFRNNQNQIPEDVSLFRVDYDSATDLKKKYNVTYQHTYVLVDDADQEIKKWNGGGIDELVANTNNP